MQFYMVLQLVFQPKLQPTRPKSCATARAVKQDFFQKKGLGRHGEGLEKVHIEPVTNQTPDALDLEALPLGDIAWVQLRNVLCS